jgi:hypothetical protein
MHLAVVPLSQLKWRVTDGATNTQLVIKAWTNACENAAYYSTQQLHEAHTALAPLPFIEKGSALTGTEA